MGANLQITCQKQVQSTVPVGSKQTKAKYGWIKERKKDKKK